jgi:hypothetical protein
MSSSTKFSLEASAPAVTVQEASTPFRQPNRLPAHCMVVHPDRIPEAAAWLLARVLQIRDHQCCAAFIYIGPNMHVYVIPEDRPIAQRWVTEHFGWLVGVYDRIHPAGRPIMRPSVAGLIEDITDHLADLARVKA